MQWFVLNSNKEINADVKITEQFVFFVSASENVCVESERVCFIIRFWEVWTNFCFLFNKK